MFKYPEEKDKSFYQKYINSEKSANLARTGTASDPLPKDAEKGGNDREPNASSTSSDTEVDKDLPINEPSGVKVDPEKGRDIHIVDWYGDNDPEVSTFQDHGLGPVLTVIRIHATGPSPRSSGLPSRYVS